MTNGKVYLVGAGPGDVGLITRRGLECLGRADVVVYDRLVDNRILEFAPRSAELIYVGKLPGSHVRQQPEINQILVDKAKEGKEVVRLKGGDPFVLGRGGEEAETLHANRIPFEIVPGVSSATAVPAYAGIPVTHRGVASSFAVITGHEDSSKELSAVNWEKLATGVDTLVCLMGMRNLSRLVEQLLAHGRAPDTPVAVIRQGTTPRQETLVGTLDTIVEAAKEKGFEPPVVTVVGEVVRLRERLTWFDNRPLFGKRVLVTRSRSQASAFSSLLAERGADPVELPVIETNDVTDPTALDRAVSGLSGYQWVLFTSANGVQAFWKRLRALNMDARSFRDVRIAAIGPATAMALEARGLRADLLPTEHTSEAMAAELATVGIAGDRILLPRSDIAPRDLTDRLVELGAEPVEVSAYLTQPATSASSGRDMLLEGKIDIVAFTSASTVANLLKALGNERCALDRAIIACIGPRTAEAAEKAGLTVEVIAPEHTVPGLVKAIELHLLKHERKDS
ncbi:MAG: uroporphyrinogen-III C-methyltransferase [Chloroflexota bacterium]|nr:uroporphyrinogen-III C-methyltransferase [Chloroflexota bacterium]